MNSLLSGLTGIFGSDLSRSVDIYCERTSAALDAEPLNALSNIAFFIAAWAAWRLQSRSPNAEHRGAVRLLCMIIVLVGAGSVTFHTIATRWAEWADVIPILIFMLTYCWLILTIFFQWPAWLKTAAILVFFASTFYLETDQFENVLWGGAMYLPAILFMIGVGVGVLKVNVPAGKAFFAAAALFVASFATRTIDMPLCSYFPIGTHYFWHVLNATVLFLLVRTLILHAPARTARQDPARETKAMASG